MSTNPQFQSSNNLYSFPQPLTRVFPPPVIAQREPESTDFKYPIGQLWVDAVDENYYGLVNVTANSATWVLLASISGDIGTLTDENGTVVSPNAGNIQLNGTANQMDTTAGTNEMTWSLSDTLIAPGSLEVTSGFTVDAGTSALLGTVHVNTSGAGVTTINTGGTGALNLGNATGNTAVTGSLTASTGLVATTGGLTVSAGGASIVGTTGINASGSAVTTIGTGGTGAVNIGNATGNTAVTGSLTASTTLTATLGAITATNGNLNLAHAGNKLLINASSSATCSAGTVTLSDGAIDVANSAVTSSSLIFVSYNVLASVNASALEASYTTSGHFTITSQDATDSSSTVNYLIIN